MGLCANRDARGNGGAVTRYEVVPGQSRVVIHARSSVHPLTVQTPVDGYLEVTLDQVGRVVDGAPVTGEVCVDVADLRSGNPLVDRETRRRLDPRQYPQIVGDLTALQVLDGQTYRATGAIAFYGASREVSGAVSLRVSGDLVTVEGRQQFDVRDWGLQPPQLLVLKVHPVVDVRLSVVLRRTG
jgi:polyisoprenoid-binding protein YceI